MMSFKRFLFLGGHVLSFRMLRPSESIFQTAFDVYLNEGTTSNVPPSSLPIKRHRVCASKSSGLGTSGKGFPFSKCTASPSWLNGCHTPLYGTRTVSPFSTSIGAVLTVLPSGSNTPSFIFGLPKMRPSMPIKAMTVRKTGNIWKSIGYWTALCAKPTVTVR